MEQESRGIALVILAAGASSRLGQCKALVPITPRSPLDLLLDAGAVLGGPQPIVITGADHDSISAAAGARAEVALNPDWREGRSGGVLLAARLRPGHDLCIAPVDTPLVPSEVFAALARAWRLAGSPAQGWAAPWVQAETGTRAFGHPVLLGRGLAARVAETGSQAPLRALRALADPLLAVEVTAREILDDLDHPEHLRELRTRPRA
jgi:CTP:molybdopterin cytidylyltransferase MocA